MCPRARQYYHSFVNESIRLGGPVGPHFTLLHDAPLAGSLELQPGLRVGGCLASAQAKVDAHAAAQRAQQRVVARLASRIRELRA